jgi:hypothetical protein
VKNSTHPINDLQGIPYNQNIKLASFDITNMYMNIPTHDLITIINEICQNSYVDNIRTDIIKLTKIIVNQNYFQFLNDNYVQTEGLAMGAPISAILSEIYMQFLENNAINNILKVHNINGYFRYVDDILIVYDIIESNTHEVLDDFNQIAQKLKFTLKKWTPDLNF